MKNTKFRHDKVTHANKVSAWKQKKIHNQRLAIAGMYSALPWYKKMWMMITVLATAIKSSTIQWKTQMRTMNAMNSTYKNYSKNMRGQSRR